MDVALHWDEFGGYTNNGLLFGTLMMYIQWNATELGESEQQVLRSLTGHDLRTIPIVKNFMSGSSGQVELGDVLPGVQPGSLQGLYKYVGSFKQSADGTCYPWERKQMEFEVYIPIPTSQYLAFELFCYPNSNCEAFNSDGERCPAACTPETNSYKTVRTESTQWVDVESVGFVWGAGSTQFTCEKIMWNLIKCTLTGDRLLGKLLASELLPGALLFVIGFLSFRIPKEMAMPRVATSMIALMTFVGKGTAVISRAPPVRQSWLEFFYVVGTFAMFQNMIGHIAMFRYPILAGPLNHFNISVVPSFFILLFAICLHSYDCELVPKQLSLSLLILSAISCFASAMYCACTYHNFVRSFVKDLRSIYDPPSEATEEPSADSVSIIGHQEAAGKTEESEL